MSKSNSPRGIRNNNPGNLRKSRDPWQGLADIQSDDEFFTFKSEIYGIRALAKTLITYQDKYNLRNIEKIITRWAPEVENDTLSYILSVERQTGINRQKQLNLHDYDDLRPLVEAIIRHENGKQPYDEAEITKALVLSGVEPKQNSLNKSRTVKAGRAATAGTVGVMVIESLGDISQPASAALVQILPYVEVAKWLLLAITLIGIIAMLWARIDDRNKGLR